MATNYHYSCQMYEVFQVVNRYSVMYRDLKNLSFLVVHIKQQKLNRKTLKKMQKQRTKEFLTMYKKKKQD